MNIGLGDAEIARAADITEIPSDPAFADFMQANPDEALSLAFMNPMGLGDHNDSRFRRAEIPGINGHSCGRALARIYGALACGGEIDGKRILSPEAITRATRENSFGPDGLMGLTTRIGLGFMLSQDSAAMTFGGPLGFGHDGAGGALSFADPEHGIGFGYVPNRMGGGTMEFDERAVALIKALYSVLDQENSA
jgi:CubicO group peptidase (beta-lactamase class C family)